ncbi:MAG: GTPase Era, partial [Luteimonas sp.]
MTTHPYRAGHVAVIGRPNVGKSTLINALVGTKISITSNRPQTTRHRLLGIASFDAGQIALVDTPGIHREQKKAMNRMMNRAARGALEGVDAALLVVEAGRWDDEDTLAYETLKQSGVPVVLVVNQVDKARDKTTLLPYLASAVQEREFAGVHPVSALKRKGLEALVDSVLALMP